jgi:hypothetical protein
LKIDFPKHERLWDINVNVLFDSLVAQNGIAMVGFKAKESPKTKNTNGYREGISSSQFEEALNDDQQGY